VLVHIFQEGDSYDYECTDDDISENYVSKHTDGIHEDSDADVNSPTNEVRVYLLYFKYH
jgi:hypothetical protein